jgi:hypothetical protein
MFLSTTLSNVEDTIDLSSDSDVDDEASADSSSTPNSLGSYHTLDAFPPLDPPDTEDDNGLVDLVAAVPDFNPPAHVAGLPGPAVPPPLSSHWMVDKKVAFDQFQLLSLPPTPQLQVETSLLKLLTKHKAPLSLFESVQEWATDSARLGHDFTRNSRRRSTVISELEDRFDFKSSCFQPTIISYLPDERPTLVYISSFADAVYSLLTDTHLTQEANLAFPDPSSPFLHEPADPALRTNVASELHHGQFYKATHKLRCTRPLDVLCPVIFYMDGVHTDAFGRLGLTPMNMSLGIYSAATRTQKEAWVTLYFHPDDEAEAAFHSQKTTAFHKVQNLHRGLDAAFAEFRTITEAGGLRWDHLQYGGQTHQVNFKFVFTFMVGDTEMHDKLCGKIASRVHASGLCRHCDCPLAESINPEYKRHLFLTSKFERALAANDLDFFKNISHYPIVNAFHKLDCGANPHGIHLASPGEILHMHQKGMEVRFVEGLGNLLHSKKNEGSVIERAMKKSLKRFDSLALQYGCLMSRSSERDLPRTKFKNSLFSGTKKAAHEQAGVLLSLLVAMLSDRGRQILLYERTISPALLTDQITMCELCLGLEEWMKKPSYTRADVRKVPDVISYVMGYVDATLKRGGMGNLLIKNHLFLHLHDYMVKWGPPRQWNSGPNESHHKTEVKAPSKNTQRRIDSFIKQTAGRYTELRLLRQACRHFGISDAELLANKPPSLSFLECKVTGARYSIGFYNHTPTMRWDSKSHNHRAAIHPAILSLVCNVVLPHLPEARGRRGHVVPCFTEHKRDNMQPGAPHCIFRAHPCFRSKEDHPKDVWYDWAYFNLVDNVKVPGQILCLMDLSSLPLGATFDYRGYAIDEPGLYAVVRLFKAPPDHSRRDIHDDPVGFLVEWGELQGGFFILNCEYISDTACVVPNLPCIPWEESRGTKKRDRKEILLEEEVKPIGGYFVIHNCDGWSYWFNDL